MIDENDGERLDRSEANALNSIIYTEYKKIFQDAVILIIAQSKKKEQRPNVNSSSDNNLNDEQMSTGAVIATGLIN